MTRTGQYLWIPLLPSERCAKVRRTRARAKGSRPAYASRQACAAAWPNHVPTLRWVEAKP
jgi:hypothetical protein